MPIVTRASGVEVEANGLEILDEDQSLTGTTYSRPLPSLADVGGRRGRRRRAAGGPSEGPETIRSRTELEGIRRAFAASEIEIVDSIPMMAIPAPPVPAAAGKRKRRSVAGAGTGSSAGVANLKIDLGPDECAAILVEQDGFYEWIVTPALEEAKATAPSKRMGRKGVAAARRGRRTAHFHVTVHARPAERRRRRGRRRSIGDWLVGKAVAIVIRFVAKKAVRKLASWMERDITPGVVQISGLDPAKWQNLGPEGEVELPRASLAPRILLMVHGTFSSTVGSFGDLCATAEGQSFLTNAEAEYDLILGFDHKTMSVTPDQNAADMMSWLASQDWRKPPIIDAVAFSRGGLVLRSFIEDLGPQSDFEYVLRRAVFVGCTNGGTELARPENWKRFADIHMNLAAAAARGLAVIPGFQGAAVILSEALKGLGSLLKVLATAAITDEAVPGLASMNPGGTFVRDINSEQPGQPTPDKTWYAVVTSDFDPDEAAESTQPHGLPASFGLRLADKATDTLYRKPNDLVVHVDSMSEIDVSSGVYVRERFDFGVNGHVHHCRYFAEADTVAQLQKWLVASL